MKIKSIKIEAFRGIPDLEHNIKGKSILIHGENGTGKSSIIDAIEFFFTGKVSHPSPFKLKDHATHVNFSSKDLKVNLEFNQGNISLERKLNSPFKYPKSAQILFENAVNGKFILRRSEILKFIESSPGKRYEFIGSVLGIKELEKIENAIKQTQNDIDSELNTKISAKNQIKSDLNSTLDEEIQNIEDILPIINKKLEKENLETLRTLDQLKERAEEINKSIKVINIPKISTLESILRNLDKINPLNDEVLDTFNKIEKIKNQIINSNQLNKLSLIEVLENSQKIISEKTEKCPLCEQGIDGENTLKKINKRLEELKKLKKDNNLLSSLVKKIKESLTLVQRHLEDISSDIKLFDNLIDEKDLIDQEITSIKSFLESVSTHSFLQGNISTKDYLKLKNSHEKQLFNLKNKTEVFKKSLSPTKEDEKRTKISKQLFEIDNKIEDYTNLNVDISKLRQELLISTKIHDNFSTIRKRKIQEVYDSIEDDIQYFYNMLHPNDLHENIKLNVDKKKRASTNLRMTIFGKKDEDPRSLSSEGHLDSLGLCIFLALFKNFNKDFPIIILDDVVSTIDSRHRENVCNLLLEEFGDKQLIITTHDGIWFEQIKAAQRAYRLGGKFENLQIIGWDIELGPIIRPYKPRWEKIQDRIKKRDSNCAGNEGRRYLEWLLENICINTKTSVKINPSGRFEINDLFDPAKQRLEKLIIDQEFKENISQSFKNLEKTRIVGNLMSHENLMAGNVSIDEVERFCNSVHEIHELMLCDGCKNPLKYYQELKIFRCSNKKCSNPLEIKAK